MKSNPGLLAVAVTLAASLVLPGAPGCSRAGTDGELAEAQTIALLIDLTARAASPGGVRETSEMLASRPLPSGSVIEAWVMGDRPEETVQIGRHVYTDPKRRGLAAVEGAKRKFRAEVVNGISAAAERARSASPARFSPIAGSLTKVVVGRANKESLTVVVLTDLREVSRTEGGSQWDFECGPLPTAKRFRRACEKEGVLREGSLDGVSVVVVGVDVEAVAGTRCPWPISRHYELTALWTSVLEGAGAASVGICRSLEEWTAEEPERAKGGRK